MLGEQCAFRLACVCRLAGSASGTTYFYLYALFVTIMGHNKWAEGVRVATYRRGRDTVTVRFTHTHTEPKK